MKKAKIDSPVHDMMSAKDWRRLAGFLLGEDTDDGVNRTLGLLGGVHGADRTWVIRYNDNFTHMWNTHEWVRAGIAPCFQSLQGIPVEAGLWIHERLERGEAVMIPDVERLPRRARTMQAELRRQGILSLLAVPVLMEGRLAFQIGHDAVNAPKTWQAPQIEEFCDAARLIGDALLRGGLSSAINRLPTEGNLSMVHLLLDSGSVAIPLPEILWIEAAGDYTIVHTAGGRRITEGRSLREWEALLSRHEFIRIHRSAMVRGAGVASLDRSGGDWRMKLAGCDRVLKVGRSHRGAVRLYLGI